MITEIQQGKKSRLELHEMLESIEKAEPAKRVDLIREFGQHSAFCDYLRCVFDPRIQFLLPGGTPPYTACEEGTQPSSWHQQNTKLQYFVKGLKGEKMNALRRETMFIGILESVSPADAEILVDMISKNSDASFTVEDVKEALPHLIS